MSQSSFGRRVAYSTIALAGILAGTGCSVNRAGNGLSNVPSSVSVQDVRELDQNYVQRTRQLNARSQHLNGIVGQIEQRQPSADAQANASSTLEQMAQRNERHRELQGNLARLTNLPDTIRAYTLQPGPEGTATTTQTAIDRGAILPRIGAAMEPLDGILNSLEGNYRVYQFVAQGTQTNENGISAIMYIVPASENESNLRVDDHLDLGFDLFHNKNTRNVRIYAGNQEPEVNLDWTEGRVIRDAALAGVSGIYWGPAAAINGGRLAIAEAIDRDGNTDNNYSGNTLNHTVSGRSAQDMYDLLNGLARRVKVENRMENSLSEIYIARIQTNSDNNAPQGIVIALGNNMDAVAEGNSPLAYLRDDDNNLMYDALEIQRVKQGDFWPLNVMPILIESTNTRTVTDGGPSNGGGFGASGPGLGGN